MNTSNQKVQIIVYYRENCRISQDVVEAIIECKKLDHNINLILVDLSEDNSQNGIFISPTIVVEDKIWAVGSYDHNKLVKYVLGQISATC